MPQLTRQRKGLRRGYFKDGLSYLKTQQYDDALKIYKNSMNRLNVTKKYKMAGISLAVASLILMKQNKFEDAKKLLDETKMKLSGLGKLFSETFAVTLIEYVIDLKRMVVVVRFQLQFTDEPSGRIWPPKLASCHYHIKQDENGDLKITKIVYFTERASPDEAEAQAEMMALWHKYREQALAAQ